MFRIVAILLHVLFSASTLFSAFVVADYFIQYDYYSTVLCQNQDKPEMQCNGKCHLALQAEQEQDKKAPLPDLEQFQIEAIASTGENQKYQAIKRFTPKPSERVIGLSQSELISRLMRPPQHIVLG